MAKQNQLTQRQEKFVRQYVVHGVGARAAREAGYAPGSARITASRLLTKVNVQSEITAERRRYERLVGLSQGQVAEELLGAFDLARSHGSAREMIAALREVGLICGYYDQPKEEKVHVNIAAKRAVDRLETLSDAELVSMAGE